MLGGMRGEQERRGSHAGWPHSAVLSLSLSKIFRESYRTMLSLLSTSPQDGKLFVLPFLQLVGTSGSGARISSLDADAYILERAATIAAHLLATDATDAVATSSLLAWVMTHVKLYGSVVPAQMKVTEVAVSALQVVLRNDFLRRLYVEEHGVERLVHMAAARNTQLLYEVAFCLWAVSLVGDYCPVLERTGAVTAVARLVRANMPIKVLRVACAVLANVAKHPDCADSVAEICETHVPEVVDALLASDPRISDPELVRGGRGVAVHGSGVPCLVHWCL